MAQKPKVLSIRAISIMLGMGWGIFSVPFFGADMINSGWNVVYSPFTYTISLPAVISYILVVFPAMGFAKLFFPENGTPNMIIFSIYLGLFWIGWPVVSSAVASGIFYLFFSWRSKRGKK